MRKSYFIFMLSALFVCTQLRAQDSFEDNKEPVDSSAATQKLKPVHIKAYPLKRESLHSSVPVQSLDETALERLVGHSVADAIRYFSGAQIKDYGGVGGLKTVNVRNMGTQHTTLFYDGLPLSNAQNGQVDLSKFSMENLEVIKLFNTGTNDLLQPAKAFSAGSVIYLLSRKSRFEGAEKTHLKGNLSSGSFGLLRPSLRIEQKISPHTTGSFSSEITHSNGRYPFRYTNGMYDTTAIRHNAGLTSFRIEAKLEGTLKDSSLWSVQGYRYQSKRGLPGAVVSHHFENHQRLWNRDWFFQGRFEKKVGAGYSFVLNFKQSGYKTRYLDPFFSNIEGKLDNQYKEKVSYVSLSQLFSLTDFWKISVATDYEADQMNANLYRFAFPKRQSLLANVASSLRLKKIEVRGNLLGSFVRDQTKFDQSGENLNALYPSASFSWAPLAPIPLRLRGAYKSSLRMPTFNELYYTLIGETSLRPEKARQFNAGITYHKTFNNQIRNSVAVTFDVYHNRVTDKIVAVPGANLFRWRMSNIGKADIKGMEIHVDHQGLIWKTFLVGLHLHYTFQKALDISRDGYHYKSKIPYAPKHSGSLTTSIDWKSISLTYGFIYTGERYSQSANIPANHLPPWYTHDASIGKAWAFDSFQFKLSGKVANLLNRHYDVIKNYPMPGRSYQILCSIHF